MRNRRPVWTEPFGRTVHQADPRGPDIFAAREQIEAACQRRERMLARGELPGPSEDELPVPSATLPGYSLLRELHRGGQGVVYLAVQTSTGRQVAMKLLRLAPRSLPSPAALARFEREIEILSRLKHRNVVTIHDCGRTDQFLYLVMDYVAGRPVDEYVEQTAPAVTKTLDLFARICDGVNAAHLRGVIHRDLKPGNILVDEQGDPHVLDFGLAKLTYDSSDALTQLDMTQTGQFVGSLPWASPEQAEGRADGLDIRTDVYSLGVILYQLLLGRFPYPVSGRLDDVVRHIVQTSPARPTSVERTIGRELETILLKCLAKEPERRYQNAGELARDIRRFLAGEVIEARRDSLAYVMAKQLARYRVCARAAAVVLIALIVALIVSIAFWSEAREQRSMARASAAAAARAAESADREAGQARAISGFLRDVLTSVEPENHGAEVRLIDALAKASAGASQRFAEHPLQEAQVRDTVGQAYFKLSKWAEARVEMQRSLALWRGAVGPDDPRTLVSATHFATVLLNLERTADAEELLRDILPRMERVFGREDRHTLSARRDTAIVYLYQNRLEEADAVLLALRRHPVLVQDDAAQIRILAGLVGVIGRRISIEDVQQLPALIADGAAMTEEWVDRSMRLFGPDSMITLHAQTRLADFICRQGRFEEAAQTARELLNRPIERMGDCHHVRTCAMLTLAEALSGMGREAEAAELQLRRLDCVRFQLASSSPPLFLGALHDTLRYLEHGGCPVEGEKLARELFDALRGLGGGHDDMALAAEMFVARFVTLQDRLSEADAMLESLLGRQDQVKDSRLRGRLHLYRGSQLTRCGRFDDAEKHLYMAAELVDDVVAGTWDSHPDDLIVEFIDLYERWGKPQQATEYHRLRSYALAGKPVAD